MAKWLNGSPRPAIGDHIKGDAICDGLIDARDALAVLPLEAICQV